MQQKNITGFEKEYETKDHPNIKGVQIIDGKNNFQISWLNQQGYCEYQIYLEYMPHPQHLKRPLKYQKAKQACPGNAL